MSSAPFKPTGFRIMKLQTRDIEYRCNNTLHRGYLACACDEECKKPVPGVLVVHEWWGINDYTRQRCEMLAELGYCALGIDMYGDGYRADNPDQAGAAMNSVLADINVATTRLRAGLDTLLAQPAVDPGKVATIGYCFGGAMALHMARVGMPLSAVVSFHGILAPFHTPEPGEIRARVLVCHGEDDAMVSMDDVAAFQSEMDGVGADYRVIVHKGAGHGFTSKAADTNAEKHGIPVGYSAAADRESWEAMQALFSSAWG